MIQAILDSLDVDNLGTGQDLDPLLGRDVVGNGGSVLVGVHQQEVQLRFQQDWKRRSAIFVLDGCIPILDSRP
jgi:hypothetical protein